MNAIDIIKSRKITRTFDGRKITSDDREKLL